MVCGQRCMVKEVASVVCSDRFRVKITDIVCGSSCKVEEASCIVICIVMYSLVWKIQPSWCVLQVCEAMGMG